MTDRNNTSLCTRKRANGCAATNLRVDFEVRYRADRDYVERGAAPAPDAYANVHAKPGEVSLMKAETWRANRDYLRCVSDFRRKHGAMLLAGTFKADEGFTVKGGNKIVANRWDSTDGRTAILVWNAAETPQKIDVSYSGQLLYAEEPESGKVSADTDIPANTLRLLVYRK